MTQLAQLRHAQRLTIKARAILTDPALDHCREALGQVIQSLTGIEPEKKQVSVTPSNRNTMDQISAMVCEEFGVTYSELLSRCRVQHLADARHAAMVLAVHVGITMGEIASYYRRADHSTICHAVDKVNDMSDAYPAFRTKMNVLLAKCEQVLS